MLSIVRNNSLFEPKLVLKAAQEMNSTGSRVKKHTKRLLFLSTSHESASSFQLLQQAQPQADICLWQPGQDLQTSANWFCVVLCLSQLAPELIHQYLAIASQWPVVIISNLDPVSELQNLEDELVDFEWLSESDFNSEHLNRAIDIAVLKYQLIHGDHFSEIDEDKILSKSSYQQVNNGLMDSIHLALQRQEFVLHFQPQINVKTGDWVGVEALTRWQHPNYGLLPPSAFMKETESTGLIQVLGRWALYEAIRAWKIICIDTGYKIRMAVNVAFPQVSDVNYANEVFQFLEENEMPFEYLELELTETTVIKNEQVTIENLSQLLSAGIKISLDDFGTGFSSLSHLNDLPISGIKLDRAFVSPLADAGAPSYISAAMITLAKQLNLETTAEGVEDIG